MHMDTGRWWVGVDIPQNSVFPIHGGATAIHGGVDTAKSVVWAVEVTTCGWNLRPGSLMAGKPGGKGPLGRGEEEKEGRSGLE